MRGASTVLGGVCADLPQKCGKAALSYSTMGGLGSVIGAFVSGIVLGLMETVGAVVVGSSFKDTIVFLAFILILVVKQTVKTRRG